MESEETKTVGRTDRDEIWSYGYSIPSIESFKNYSHPGV